jgi:hypothetical protein
MNGNVIPLPTRRAGRPLEPLATRRGHNQLRERALGPYRILAIPDTAQILVREDIAPEERERALAMLEELFAEFLSLSGMEARLTEELAGYVEGGPTEHLGVQFRPSAFMRYARRLGW